MQKTILAITLSICFSITVRAQTRRYKDIIFRDVVVDKDQTYNPAAVTDDKKAYLFDLFQPKDDNEQHRPLIIWMHGGGFKFGTKDAKDIQLWSKSFAERGYVCAAINYRLSKKNPLFHFDELLKGCYYAVQDAKLAVAYFKKNAAKYGIDPNKIILAGNSAGGMIALQAAYSHDDELAKMAGLPAGEIAKAGSSERFQVAAVINFWGAIYNLDWLKNANVPIVSALGSKDGVVPPTHKSAPLYGGVDIHNEADKLKIPNELKVFDGYSHQLQKHFNPIFPAAAGTRNRWLEAGQFAADFLYTQLYK